MSVRAATLAWSSWAPTSLSGRECISPAVESTHGLRHRRAHPRAAVCQDADSRGPGLLDRQCRRHHGRRWPRLHRRIRCGGDQAGTRSSRRGWRSRARAESPRRQSIFSMNILFLAQRVPYAPDRGDRIRAWNILRFLKTQGHRVRVVAVAHDRTELGVLAELEGHGGRMGVCAAHPPCATSPGRRWQRFPAVGHLLTCCSTAPRLFPASEIVREFSPRVVYAYCSGLANLALEPPLASLPCILDLVDIDSAKWHDLATQRELADALTCMHERVAPSSRIRATRHRLGAWRHWS